MSLASDMVQSGKFPADWNDGIAEMKDTLSTAYQEIDSVGPDALVPAIRYARDEEGNTVFGEDGTPDLVALHDENGVVMEPHPLIHREQYHGLHAYRYEQMDDGSVVALYVNDRSLEVKALAFDTLAEASAWSPRDERAV
jgi:hypothetical protein